MEELNLQGVIARKLDDELREAASWDNCTLVVRPGAKECSLQLKCGDQMLVDTSLQDTSEVFSVGGGKSVLIGSSSDDNTNSFLLIPHSSEEATKLWTLLAQCWGSQVQEEQQQKSVFDERSEESSAQQYFQWYAHFWQQQNMLQDYVRTATYQSAFLQNSDMFKDKVVLDVGAGSGILSFFAVQAGARKVYAVDASEMATHCQKLVDSNGLADRITVIRGKIEEVVVPEKVDLLISEPIGYMLYNERMVESYLHAKKWLKPGGHMMPTQGDLYVAPFTDEQLYMEQMNKVQFWQQKSFYSVDLSPLREAAHLEYLSQPIKDTFDPRIVMAKPHKSSTNYKTALESDLYKIEIPLDFELTKTGTIHGLAFWFDIAFIGTSATVWLSTAPHQPTTHWHQIRCLLITPLLGHKGEHLTGTVVLNANDRLSYDVDIQVSVGVGPDKKSSYSKVDLKNPYFRFSSMTPAPPPGSTHENPTDQFWSGDGSKANKQASASSYANPPASHFFTMNTNLTGMGALQGQQMMTNENTSSVGVAEPPKQ